MSSFRDLEREEVDPEGRYQVYGLTQVERQALRVIKLLRLYRMERTRDVFQFTALDNEAQSWSSARITWNCGCLGSSGPTRTFRPRRAGSRSAWAGRDSTTRP